MKKVLLDYKGIISEICDPGQEYEIYEGSDANCSWVDAPDDVTYFWSLEWSPSKNAMVWIEREQPFADPILKRQIAYGSIGEQLDMLYRDIKSGKISEGEWVSHIDTIKETVPKPYDDEVSMEEIQQKLADNEPDSSKPVIYSNRDLPAWVRYSGWKGFTA
jgi:hypothetical protein